MSRFYEFLPRFALVEIHNPSDPEGNYWIVEKFSHEKHMMRCQLNGGYFYTSRPDVNLFNHPSEDFVLGHTVYGAAMKIQFADFSNAEMIRDLRGIWDTHA